MELLNLSAISRRRAFRSLGGLGAVKHDNANNIEASFNETGTQPSSAAVALAPSSTIPSASAPFAAHTTIALSELSPFTSASMAYTSPSDMPTPTCSPNATDDISRTTFFPSESDASSEPRCSDRVGQNLSVYCDAEDALARALYLISELDLLADAGSPHHPKLLGVKTAVAAAMPLLCGLRKEVDGLRAQLAEFDKRISERDEDLERLRADLADIEESRSLYRDQVVNLCSATTTTIESTNTNTNTIPHTNAITETNTHTIDSPAPLSIASSNGILEIKSQPLLLPIDGDPFPGLALNVEVEVDDEEMMTTAAPASRRAPPADPSIIVKRRSQLIPDEPSKHFDCLQLWASQAPLSTSKSSAASFSECESSVAATTVAAPDDLDHLVVQPPFPVRIRAPSSARRCTEPNLTHVIPRSMTATTTRTASGTATHAFPVSKATSGNLADSREEQQQQQPPRAYRCSSPNATGIPSTTIITATTTLSPFNCCVAGRRSGPSSGRLRYGMSSTSLSVPGYGAGQGSSSANSCPLAPAPDSEADEAQEQSTLRRPVSSVTSAFEDHGLGAASVMAAAVKKFWLPTGDDGHHHSDVSGPAASGAVAAMTAGSGVAPQSLLGISSPIAPIKEVATAVPASRSGRHSYVWRRPFTRGASSRSVGGTSADSGVVVIIGDGDKVSVTGSGGANIGGGSGTSISSGAGMTSMARPRMASAGQQGAGAPSLWLTDAEMDAVTAMVL